MKGWVIPVLTVERIQSPNRMWAIPVLGILAKGIILIPVLLWLGLLAFAMGVLLFINSFVVLFSGQYWDPAYELVVQTTGLGLRTALFLFGLTDRYPGFLRHVLIELGYLKSAHSISADSVAFNVQPRRTGQLLIGSSRQFGAEDLAIDTHMLNWMLQRCVEYMPGLASLAAIRCWTGFRAATPDKLPLIGPTADPRLYLATGHEGLGITTSLATAKLLVDQVLHRASAIPLEPYLPCREMSH